MRFPSITRLALCAAALAVAGCAAKPVQTETAHLVMRWDHRPEASQWTDATLEAMRTHGASLAAMNPSDIEHFCPGYRTASVEQRNAFWAGLLSALAKHESTWNPVAVGGGGRWFGLVQIDPRTARGYDCAAKSGSALKDGAANLRCAVRIATHQVVKRGTVSRGMLDWGPFHSKSKREEMAAWTRAQSYCQPKPEKPRLALAFPVVKPPKADTAQQ